MNPRSFHYDENGAIATLRLDRPAALNALTFEVYRELIETFRALRDRPAVRVAVLTGTGKAFCTGGDVKDIIGQLVTQDAEARHEFTTMTCDLIRAMRQAPQPSRWHPPSPVPLKAWPSCQPPEQEKLTAHRLRSMTQSPIKLR